MYYVLTPLSGSNDLLSFNPMAEPGEQRDSEFVEFQQGSSSRSVEIPSMHVILQTTPIVPEISQPKALTWCNIGHRFRELSINSYCRVFLLQ
jgi:hypothetical protein